LIPELWGTVHAKLAYLIALILRLLRSRARVLEPETSGALEVNSIMAEWRFRVLAVSRLLKETTLRLRGSCTGHDLLAVRAHLKHGLRPEVTFLHNAVLGLEGLIGWCLVPILLPHPAGGGETREGWPARGYHPLVQVLDGGQARTFKGFLTLEVRLVKHSILHAEGVGVVHQVRHEEPPVLIVYPI
jgi:hypothetical protein